MIQVLFFLIGFLICIFLLYLFSKQDFVLLRQNISLSQIFDSGAIALFLGFIFGRIFYVLNNFDFSLLNIFKFFHIFLFPGISFLGLFLGLFVALLFSFRKQKMTSRIYDIFTISFMPLFILNSALRAYPSQFPYVGFFIPVFLIVVFVFFIQAHNRYVLSDGSIFLIFIFLVATDTALSQFLNSERFLIIGSFSFLQAASVSLIILSLILFLLNQKFSKK